ENSRYQATGSRLVRAAERRTRELWNRRRGPIARGSRVERHKAGLPEKALAPWQAHGICAQRTSPSSVRQCSYEREIQDARPQAAFFWFLLSQAPSRPILATESTTFPRCSEK